MHIDYTYTHEQTLATTGYFSCEPHVAMTLEEKLEYLTVAYLDTFLHRHLLTLLGAKSLGELQALVEQSYNKEQDSYVNKPLAALLLELAYLYPNLEPLKELLPSTAASVLAPFTPMPYLAIFANQDVEKCATTLKLMALGISSRKIAPLAVQFYTSDEIADEFEKLKARQPLLQTLSRNNPQDEPTNNSTPALSLLYRQAVDVLVENGFLHGQEMRHEASLAPYGLLRDFNLNITVQDGQLDYRLQGVARAYGRGLSILEARVSYIMEIIERVSAYVSVEQKLDKLFVTERCQPFEIYKQSYQSLVASHKRVLDPNSLPLETHIPNDLPLSFVQAFDAQHEEILVPAQSVFLFWNTLEHDLMLAPPSTGLAAGTSLAQAKVHALCEILERDAEATMPFRHERCFILKSRDPKVQGLLDAYAAKNIAIQFQDLTTEMGIPIYQCFVRAVDGQVVTASACNLNAKKACLAALTETPWPFSLTNQSAAVASDKALDNLATRYLEDLPNYSLNTPQADLQLLEELLIKCGYMPLYVDISRADLEFFVVRALISNLQLTKDFEYFAKPPLSLLARYLAYVE